MTPQQQIALTLEADGPTLVYVLEVSESYFRGWVMERFPGVHLDGVVVGQKESSLIALDAFLDAHPDSVFFTDEDRTISWEFAPKRVMNATGVMANSGYPRISFDYDVEVSTILAPPEVALPQALVLLTLGIIIALPWAVSTVSKGRLGSR
jgi:hypothetical protein